MSIAFVQSRSSQGTSGGLAASLAFNSSNTAGNTIIVLVVNNAPDAASSISPSVSDGNGNTYNTAVSALGWSGTQYGATLYWATGIASGANTVDFAFNGTIENPYSIILAEYSGSLTTKESTNESSGFGTSPASGSVTSSDASALYITGVGVDSTVVSLSTPSGFTSRQSSLSSPAFVFADLITTGSQSPTSTIDSGHNWGMVSAVFGTPSNAAAGSMQIAFH